MARSPVTPILPRRQSTHEPDDAVGLMLACHTRIRSFGSLAARIALDTSPSDEEVAEAAAALHRYFSVALPLHVADEDLSLRPRLERFGAPAEVREALSRMSMQHLDIDQVLAEALPLWLALSRGEASRAQRSKDLVSLGRSLGEHFDGHLDLEERVIFPVVRTLLPADEEEALAGEIRRRRSV
ncbi:MAG: hemerythrin domain-containing protein [Deltaproteobacteria bacterium]|nr:hemerythrin domain-containing protein [Deltaproteobacteria bacterium]